MSNRWSTQIILALCCCLLVAAFPAKHSLAAEQAQTNTTPQTIHLTGLLPMSGELASHGEPQAFAFERAVAEANRRWHEDQVPLQFELTIENSESDPSISLALAKKAWQQGRRIFMVASSAEAAALLPWANANDALIISQASTSPALSVADDSLFRMVPDDTEQMKALVNLLVYERMLGVVPVYRNDVYGQQLAQLLSEEFVQTHGLIAPAVAYEPQNADWDRTAADIAAAAAQLNLPRDQIAIAFFGFDEIAQLLGHNDDIADLHWFTTDGVTLSSAAIDNVDVAQQALAGQLKGVTFGLPETAREHLITAELTAFTEGAPLPNAFFAYDIPGMLAAVLTPLPEPRSIAAIKQAMIDGSKTHVGVTGWTILNEQGDRKYYSYDVWAVATGPDGHTWQKTGKYVRNPGMPGYILPLDTNTQDPYQPSTKALFGYDDQLFELERQVTRAEFTFMFMAALEANLANSPWQEASFVDASDIDPRAQAAVAAAKQQGIVRGNGRNDFQPNRPVTLFEALTMAERVKRCPLVEQCQQRPSEPEAGKNPLSYGDAVRIILGIRNGGSSQ